MGASQRDLAANSKLVRTELSSQTLADGCEGAGTAVLMSPGAFGGKVSVPSPMSTGWRGSSHEPANYFVSGGISKHGKVYAAAVT